MNLLKIKMMKNYTIMFWAVLMLINTTTKIHAQDIDYTTISGGLFGDDRDIFVINSDESAQDAAIRFQSKAPNGMHYDWSIFNQLDEKELNFALYSTDSHTDDDESKPGNVFMQISSEGIVKVTNSMVIGDTADRLAAGSSLTVIGDMNILSDSDSIISENDYLLSVEGGIVSSDFYLANPAGWADFVFDKNYKLPSLEYVENFINENGHLPNVPSEKKIKEKGYDIHDMNVVLLQQIEELTLHTIKQRKLLKNALEIAAKKN